jgi:hypothetical protein
VNPGGNWRTLRRADVEGRNRKKSDDRGFVNANGGRSEGGSQQRKERRGGQQQAGQVGRCQWERKPPKRAVAGGAWQF